MRSISKKWLILVVGLLWLPGLLAYYDQPRHTPTTSELKQKLSEGILKLNEGDVVKLMGLPDHWKHPGEEGSPILMHWDYATFIFVTFEDGKLVNATGSFSFHLPVDRVNATNFRSLRAGMTDAEVTNILRKETFVVKKGASVVRCWGRNAEIEVSLNKKGLVIGPSLRERNAVFMPADMPIPVPLGK